MGLQYCKQLGAISDLPFISKQTVEHVCGLQKTGALLIEVIYRGNTLGGWGNKLLSESRWSVKTDWTVYRTPLVCN
jgi:hypothetical protein